MKIYLKRNAISCKTIHKNNNYVIIKSEIKLLYSWVLFVKYTIYEYN